MRKAYIGLKETLKNDVQNVLVINAASWLGDIQSLNEKYNERNVRNNIQNVSG